jgi:hypothetical protein
VADLCLQANGGKLICKTCLKFPDDHPRHGAVFSNLGHYNRHQYVSCLRYGAVFDQVTGKPTLRFMISCLSGVTARRITGTGTRLRVTSVLISQ